MRGVHAAIVTHFDGDLKIDHDAVAAQVQRLIAGGVDGIVACGTMGEANSLSRTERDGVVRTAIAAAHGKVPVCVGVSAPSAEHAARYARDAAAAGADSLMSLPPLLYRADRRELREFFVEVSAATELPLMIYNNPEASGIDLGPALLAELTRELPAVTAVKETSGDARRIADLLERCDGIDVLVGGDDWALEGACLGAGGWISGVAVVVPERCAQLWTFGTTGELEQARHLYAELLPLARFDMTSKLVQYFKAALDELGIGGGPCRPPRLPLTGSELEALREATALVARGATQV
jgi:dihydrodipicolinate synthase/N-acetylneuraminate lyase